VKRVLIANRGEIALRILRTCHAMGLEAYVATSEADRDSLAAQRADRAVCIGPSRPTDSYLRRELLLEAASKLECDAIHPGYGFLAEDPLFAEGCSAAGIRFIGPSPDNLRLFGDKVSARNAAARAGVPIAAGSPPIEDVELALTTARDIGFPVMIKAAKGGGGKGMRVVTDEDSLRREFPMASTEAAAAFGDGSVYLERFVARGRHVEVQVVGSPSGEAVHLGDRDCSVQRQNQKLIEEAPAPFIAPVMQEDLRNAAVELARSSGYDNVGTVEFLLDSERGEFYFLEVNPRIQVEHGVTELVTGMDIVALQIQIADTGRHGLVQEDIDFRGSAIECRINAESPRQDFRPSPGRIIEWTVPEGPAVRVDSHCYPGYFVPPFYDSLVAKLMVHEHGRDTAIAGMLRALSQLHVKGIDTTAELARSIVGSAEFARLDLSTRWLGDLLAGGRWPGDDQGRHESVSPRAGVPAGLP
jgi:acetyl-CoA carboxylase biotin carboxylase subunit